MTALAERPSAPETPRTSAPPEEEPARRTGWLLAVVLAGWLTGWALFQGRATLPLARATLTGFQTRLNEVRDNFNAARGNNLVLDVVVGGIRDGLSAAVETAQGLVSQRPSHGRCPRSAGSGCSPC